MSNSSRSYFSAAPGDRFKSKYGDRVIFFDDRLQARFEDSGEALIWKPVREEWRRLPRRVKGNNAK